MTETLTPPVIDETTQSVGSQMYDFIAEMYPICRSLTGDGVRETLKVIAKHVPIQTVEVPSGTSVLDWTVPKEWNIRDAYVKNSKGERIIDFKKSCLHVLGYSLPVRGKFTLEELKPRLYSNPKLPDAIPFRYSYYNENWGFCLPHSQLAELKEDTYEVLIDSTLEEGHLTYGEFYLPGETEQEVLVCTHIDHPAMCNDNLSGIAVATFLAKRLMGMKRKYSYRFIYIPTTIGSITWLSRNEDKLHNIVGGFTLTCIGDDAGFTWKETRRANTPIDRAMRCALRECGEPFSVRDFNPFGFDERQFNSPGFNLPIGSLLRTPAHDYIENHTSFDNLSLMKPDKLEASVAVCEKAVNILEGNVRYLNLRPKAEPQLGKWGIYRKVGGSIPEEHLFHLFWILNWSDGEHALIDIAEKSKYKFQDLQKAANILHECELLQQLD